MTAISGRDDNRLFKYIYADGLGGVVDYRLSAWDMSSAEESAKVKEKVKNGSYRGLEKLVYSYVSITLPTANYTFADKQSALLAYSVAGALGNKATALLKNGIIGDVVYLVKSNGDVESFTSDNKSGGWIPHSNGLVFFYPISSDVDRINKFLNGYSGVLSIVVETTTETSVSGNFTTQDVIGDPSIILKTDALKNGWCGRWIGIPSIGGKAQYGTRKNVSTKGTPLLATSNNGSTWSSYPTGTLASNVTNHLTDTYSTTEIRICSYTAFANQTVEDENRPILNGSAGIGDVWTYNGFYSELWGNLLQESLIGKVGISADVLDFYGNASMTNTKVRQNSLLETVATRPNIHAPLTLSTPTNNSPAMKTLISQTAINGQCNLQCQANELTYDGSSFVPWGDDSTIKITGKGSSTFKDLNGNVNKQVVHKLAMSYGYTMNHARAGGQVSGVDLYDTPTTLEEPVITDGVILH